MRDGPAVAGALGMGGAEVGAGQLDGSEPEVRLTLRLRVAAAGGPVPDGGPAVAGGLRDDAASISTARTDPLGMGFGKLFVFGLMS